MDIITHILSGAAVATVVAVYAPGKPAKKLKLITAGAFGGMLPDVDAISLWSGFDATVGRVFGLDHSGAQIYGAKLWYSHHAFLHSIAAGIISALIFGLVSYVVWGRRGPIIKYFRSQVFVALAFMAGYLMHLLGDMPTPASVWGGVRMFWPATNYVGGTGQIWWWNNYDITLIVAACVIVNVVVIILKNHRRTVLCVAALALILSVIQINTRQFDYAYKGNTDRYAQMEERSLQEQERILGQRLYKAIRWVDNHLSIHF